MRYMTALFTVSALLAATSGGWAGDKKSALEGTWKLSAVSVGGKEFPIPEDVGFTVTIAAGGKLTHEIKGMKDEGTYKVDNSKTPKQIDVTMKKGDKQETMMGIYEIKGDTLRVAMFDTKKIDTGMTRPASFDAPEAQVMIFKRASK